MALGIPRHGRGVISVPVGRKFAIQSPVDCAVSISPSAAGDASVGDVTYAQIIAGKAYVFFIPAAAPPQFLSGQTTDPNGDTSPTQLTFIDSGASGI
jgi:hypothetical protein